MNPKQFPESALPLLRKAGYSPPVNRGQQSFFALLNPVYPARQLFRHRGLWWQFARRQFEMRHRGSLLGALWAVVTPLLMLGMYLFIFGYIFEGSFGAVPNESQWDYGLGIFLGLSIFHLVAETMMAAPGVIVNQPNFVKKVVFPLEILPAAAVGSACFHMLISIAMVLLGAALSSRGLSWGLLWLPVIVTPVITLALGMSWILSALGVFFRDLVQVVPLVQIALMYASAIFYPVARIQEFPWAWLILRFNPLIHLVDLARNAVLWHRPVDVNHVIWLNVAGFGVAIFGYAVFGRMKPAFADVI